MFFHPGWLFAIASVIAVFGIVVSFKQWMEKIQEELVQQEKVDPPSLQRHGTRFFIKVLAVEAIPIVLVIIGFILLESYVGTIEVVEILAPLALVIATFVVGVVQMFMARSQTLNSANVPVNAKGLVTTNMFIGLGLLASFPIIAIVGHMILIA